MLTTRTKSLRTTGSCHFGVEEHAREKSGLCTVFGPSTVRFFLSYRDNPTVRVNAVLRKRKSLGTVRCGFQTQYCTVHPTVRFGAVINVELFIYRKSYGAVRCDFRRSYMVRCGSVLSCILRYGSVRVSKSRNPTVRDWRCFQI